MNYPETYDQIFARLSGEFKAAAAAGQPIKHLILLLGVPIAYPVSLIFEMSLFYDSADVISA